MTVKTLTSEYSASRTSIPDSTLKKPTRILTEISLPARTLLTTAVSGRLDTDMTGI